MASTARAMRRRLEKETKKEATKLMKVMRGLVPVGVCKCQADCTNPQKNLIFTFVKDPKETPPGEKNTMFKAYCITCGHTTDIRFPDKRVAFFNPKERLQNLYEFYKPVMSAEEFDAYVNTVPVDASAADGTEKATEESPEDVPLPVKDPSSSTPE